MLLCKKNNGVSLASEAGFNTIEALLMPCQFEVFLYKSFKHPLEYCATVSLGVLFITSLQFLICL